MVQQNPTSGAKPHHLFTPRDFRDAMGRFGTGVVIISTAKEGEVHAMTANAFMSGSLDPVLVMVSVAKTARMHERVRQTQQFGISILSQNQQWVSNHFAGKPTPDRDPRFENLDGAPVVDGAMVRLVTDLWNEYDCGDHTLFVGKVRALEMKGDQEKPLLYFGGRYRHVAPVDWSDTSMPQILWQDHDFSY